MKSPWAQVVGSAGSDRDSEAGNGTYPNVAEDDEARIVINQRAQDCNLAVDVVESACAPDDRSAWRVTLAGAADTLSDRQFDLRVGSGPARAWAFGSERSVVLDADSLLRDDVTSVPFVLTRASDATCGSRVLLYVPQECARLTATRERFRSEGVTFAPNPIRAGAEFSLRGLATEGPSSASVFDVLGRRAGSVPLECGKGVLPQGLPGGTYVVVVGEHVARILVE